LNGYGLTGKGLKLVFGTEILKTHRSTGRLITREYESPSHGSHVSGTIGGGF
jgi:hypothetical protein